jgi:cell division protein FtsW (lipid II flippase)
MSVSVCLFACVSLSVCLCVCVCVVCVCVCVFVYVQFSRRVKVTDSTFVEPWQRSAGHSWTLHGSPRDSAAHA